MTTPTSAEPVEWRKRELSYVVEECKRIGKQRLSLEETRDALADLMAWASNRLTAAPTPAAEAETCTRAEAIMLATNAGADLKDSYNGSYWTFSDGELMSLIDSARLAGEGK